MTFKTSEISEARRNETRDKKSWLEGVREKFGGTAHESMQHVRGSVGRILDTLSDEAQGADDLAEQNLEVSQVMQLLQGWVTDYSASFASAVGTGVDNSHRRIAGVFFFQPKNKPDVFPLQVTMNFASGTEQIKQDAEASTNISIAPKMSSSDIAMLVERALRAIEQNPEAANQSIMLDPETARLLNEKSESNDSSPVEVHVLN